MIDGHLFFALPKGGTTREVDAAPGVLARIKPSRELGFHALRHTCASVQLEAGESIVSLARGLGRADPGFTLRTYTHFMPDVGTRGRAAMDAWVSGEANSLETP